MLKLSIPPLLAIVMAFQTMAADEPITPKTATKEHPFVNSLGMKFAPVPITGGPTNGKLILFSIWDTRVQDYDVFLKETQREHKQPKFEQGPTHPVVNVSWTDSAAFCVWLSKKEGMVYRLPSDHEWSCAVGIGEKENPKQWPEEKACRLKGQYPWGTEWPPPKNAGNYDALFGVDSFPNTSPVGSFAANLYGLFDLGGNVLQWCQDLYEIPERKFPDYVTRGASWNSDYPVPYKLNLLSSSRLPMYVDNTADDIGFRCVLDVTTE